jgi:hypothetical protein
MAALEATAATPPSVLSTLLAATAVLEETLLL